MAVDEASLERQYDVVQLSVQQSTQISRRAQEIVGKLTAETAAGAKPVLLRLQGRSKAATKLISIVEIAKRDLSSQGISCNQYNALSSVLVDIPRQPKKQADAPEVDGKGDGEDSGDAFQSIEDPLGETKKRNQPVLTIYLSKAWVKELRNECGYVIDVPSSYLLRLTDDRQRRLRSAAEEAAGENHVVRAKAY
jgi:hypothetical protein